MRGVEEGNGRRVKRSRIHISIVLSMTASAGCESGIEFESECDPEAGEGLFVVVDGRRGLNVGTDIDRHANGGIAVKRSTVVP